MSRQLLPWFPKGRLEALTDGVYAVALTLLVLDLKLPEGPISADLFTAALLGQLSNALTWLLSFWVILIFWQSRVELMRCVERVGNTFVQMDLLHLALISLLPFSTSLIGEHSQHTLSYVIYTANLWLIALFGFLQVYHMRKVGLGVPADIDPKAIDSLGRFSKHMLWGISAALVLSPFAPGWNLLAIMIPKLLVRR